MREPFEYGIYGIYANMASQLNPSMSDQELLSALISHYGHQLQRCLLSAKLKTTQEALAFLSKLQTLEESKETHREHRQDSDHRGWNRRPSRNIGNDDEQDRQRDDRVQVRHIRRNGGDKYTGR
jgi:hypothetical protein